MNRTSAMKYQIRILNIFFISILGILLLEENVEYLSG